MTFLNFNKLVGLIYEIFLIQKPLCVVFALAKLRCLFGNAVCGGNI